MDINKVAELLKQGKVGVFPTDTLYGIHGLALNREVVEHIYKLRHRELHKPFIVLIGDIEDLTKFGVQITDLEREFLDNHWPGKVSIILPCTSNSCNYIHRGLGSIAFRIPAKEELRELLRLTGPLVSTSVNPSGQEPAKTIEEAKEYFGDSIDFYIDEGSQTSPPSTLIKLHDGDFTVLREGAVKLQAE